MSKVIAVAGDCEFTSWDRFGGDVISTGLVKIMDDYTLGDSKIFYSRPYSPKYFTEAAQKIHKISYFKAQTFPSRKDSCLAMMHWLAEDMEHFPLNFVYHGNGKLDWKHLEAHFQKEELTSSFYRAFPESKIESTLSLSREKLKNIAEPTIVKDDGKLVTKYSLPNVAQHYDIHNELDHHNALSDAIICAKIYCNIKQDVGTWTGALF